MGQQFWTLDSGERVYDKQTIAELMRVHEQKKSAHKRKIAEPYINCLKEYHEDICGACELLTIEQVAHPGGSSVHSVDKSRCEEGFWENDF